MSDAAGTASRRLVILRWREDGPEEPVAILYPDGRIEGTDDPEVVRRIRAAIDDEDAEMRMQLEDLYEDPVWQKYDAAIMADPTLMEQILHDMPADLSEAMARHRIVIRGPASRHDTSSAEWAWLVAAGLMGQALIGRPVGYALPTGVSGVGIARPPRQARP